ncbi:hypothetical protein [Desulfurivibrio sp. C05AmB]|uniref:hypothetical protein n=1 Tax=Desulfurivibrio sp. C05AmB TaxID=3374371 RepID=UPI00376EFBE1
MAWKIGRGANGRNGALLNGQKDLPAHPGTTAVDQTARHDVPDSSHDSFISCHYCAQAQPRIIAAWRDLAGTFIDLIQHGEIRSNQVVSRLRCGRPRPLLEGKKRKIRVKQKKASKTEAWKPLLLLVPGARIELA